MSVHLCILLVTQEGNAHALHDVDTQVVIDDG